MGSPADSGNETHSHPYAPYNDAVATITAVGDVNQDGTEDLAVGDHIWYWDSDAVSNWAGGAAYLLFGPISTDSQLAEADFALRPSEPFDPETRDGSAALGSDFINVGDLTGDGFDEIAVTGHGMSDADLGITTWQGAGAYVIEGPPVGELVTDDALARYVTIGLDVVPAGDANGDGYQDIALGGYDGPYQPGVYLAMGPMSGAHRTEDLPDALLDTTASGVLGQCLDGPADLDGDGALDLVVGHPDQPSGGVAYVVPLPWEGVTEVAAHATLRISYEEHNGTGHLGQDVGVIPDQDGDGIADLLIGDENGKLKDGSDSYRGLV